MKRLVCVILSAALLFCLSSCGQKPKMRREIDNSKLLRVSEDGYLTDGSDNGIQLRGVNFGGWLLQETWMWLRSRIMSPVLALYSAPSG